MIYRHLLFTVLVLSSTLEATILRGKRDMQGTEQLLNSQEEGFFDDIGGLFGDIGNKAKSAISDVNVNNIVDGVKKIGTRIKDNKFLDSVGSSIKNKLDKTDWKGLGNDLIETVAGGGERIKDKLASIDWKKHGNDALETLGDVSKDASKALLEGTEFAKLYGGQAADIAQEYGGKAAEYAKGKAEELAKKSTRECAIS